MADAAIYKLKRRLIPEPFEVLDGAMLGDGNLSKPSVNACFRYSKSRGNFVDLVNYVKEQLENLGVTFAPNMPRTLADGSSWLSSRVHPILTGEYLRWYQDGVKEIPEDIHLAPRTLAVLFMDDGSSTYSHKKGPAVTTYLATHCFSEHSIEVLEQCLLSEGISTGRNHDRRVKKGAGIYVTILQSSVDFFMSTIEPYIVSSYLYKIKYRRS